MCKTANRQNIMNGGCRICPIIPICQEIKIMILNFCVKQEKNVPKQNQPTQLYGFNVCLLV